MKVNIKKFMKYPSRASKELGAINFGNDQDFNACIEEVRTINEEANFEELPLDEPTLEVKTLPSILNYSFLDTEQTKLTIHFHVVLEYKRSYVKTSFKLTN